MISFSAYKKVIVIAAGLILFAGCEKPLDLDIPQSQTRLVVDGFIEQGKFPVVYLSTTLPFFSTIDSAALIGAIVSRAKVTVSDGERSEILMLMRDASHYPPVYYRGTKLKGELNKTYYLTVEYMGQVLTSETTILNTPVIDSLWFKAEKDSLGSIWLTYNNTSQPDQYFRTFYLRKGKDVDYKPTYINTFKTSYLQDSIISFTLFKGSGSFSDLYASTDKYFVRGDTVMMKICNMDRAHFDFWNSVQGKQLNLTGFGSNTNAVKSNIKGGVGVWGGYASSYYTLILK